MFHATYLAYLPEILKHGLIPGVNRNWSYSQNYVYLTTDPKEAVDFAVVATEEGFVDEDVYLSGIVLLEVKVDVANLSFDPNCDDEENPDIFFRHSGPIPPSKIRVVEIMKTPRSQS